jgi:hypothetical protein
MRRRSTPSRWFPVAWADYGAQEHAMALLGVVGVIFTMRFPLGVESELLRFGSIASFVLENLYVCGLIWCCLLRSIACAVEIDPSWPVFMAWSMSSASPACVRGRANIVVSGGACAGKSIRGPMHPPASRSSADRHLGELADREHGTAEQKGRNDRVDDRGNSASCEPTSAAHRGGSLRRTTLSSVPIIGRNAGCNAGWMGPVPMSIVEASRKYRLRAPEWAAR